jgi:hypothetical protein
MYVFAAIGAVALCGCGHDPGTRALSGGAIGAGAGAVGASILGGSAATGAAIGAIGGAVAGAATTPDHSERRRDAYDRGYNDGAHDEYYGR